MGFWMMIFFFENSFGEVFEGFRWVQWIGLRSSESMVLGCFDIEIKRFPAGFP